MSIPAAEFVSTCLDEVQLSQRFVPYIQRAEDAGYPQLAKLFRALVACETARDSLFRHGMVTHADQTGDFYVCPHCGLIYDGHAPDQCVVDQTPAADFIVIR